MWGDIAIAFALALVVAFITTPYTIKLAKKVGAIDVPKDERRVHKEAIPRIGGLAIICGFFVAALYILVMLVFENKIDLNSDSGKQLLGLVLGSIVLVVVCFIDDVKDIPAIYKLIGQVVAALIAIMFGIRIVDVQIPFFSNMIMLNEVFSFVLTLVWIVGITNAINLIDGLDGLAVGISAIASISLLIVFALNASPIIAILLMACLCGALCGFLPFNFHPAKTFVGDVGANFLGYIIALLSIMGLAKTYTAIVIIAPIVLAFPILDTVMAFFRRTIKEKSIKAFMKPDKKHLHHRIMRLGYSQKQAVIIIYMFTAVLGIFAIILFDSGVVKALSFLAIIVIATVIGIKQHVILEKDSDVVKEK